MIDEDTPSILIILKQCARYGMANKEFIKSLSFNDLLGIIIELQIDEINDYLSSQPGAKKTVIADEEEVTKLLVGNIPEEV